MLSNTPDFISASYSNASPICHTDLVDNLNDVNNWITAMSNNQNRILTANATLSETDRHVVYQGSGNVSFFMPNISSVDPKHNFRIINDTDNAIRLNSQAGQTLINPYTGASTSSENFLYLQGDAVDVFPISANTWSVTPVFENNARVYLRADLSGPRTLTAANPEPIIFDNPIVSPLGGAVYNNTTGVYNVLVDGFYKATVYYSVDPLTADDTIYAGIQKNGTLYAASAAAEPANAAAYRFGITSEYIFERGDTIRPYIYKIGTGSGGVVSDNFAFSYFEVSLINRYVE